MTRLFRRLALETGRRCEGGVRLQLVQLGSEEDLLLIQVVL